MFEIFCELGIGALRLPNIYSVETLLLLIFHHASMKIQLKFLQIVFL